ncbi:ankyrin repeat domain-containing protein [uncultured Winogradskyella sp.]|uniref:ankyrin repeat domain-containing protein n=1 Tax=uncultured Winogradskyella sp. TaxID=395353 RepID=UPI002635121F|nr:ankyrin repeat domain-containing protein [uncultured Winogradskyella sp.]
MKSIKPLLIICFVLFTSYVSGQLCDQDKRFTSVEYFLDSQIDSLKNVTYGNAIDYKGKSQNLKMDFYFPDNKLDTVEKRPFILLIHGGGFVGGQKEGFAYHCKELAKRGYVAATMSYRLGFDKNVMGENAKAVYRAQQDTHTALNYVSKQAENLRIDTQWVFVGGSSAGAITSLYAGFANQAEWNSVLPQFESLLGPLKASEDSQAQNISIKGIYNKMGAVFPMVFTSGDLIPAISFHGDKDKTVPIGKSQIAGFGSTPIHEILTKAGVCNNLTIVQGGGHSIYISKEGEDFRINRIANFFKSLICDSCTSNVFKDQVDNNRTEITFEELDAIKNGSIQELDALIDVKKIDKCHGIQGGLYNYLAFSIKLESFESLKYFVNKKANLEGNCTGKTPLMYAAKYGQLDAVKLLLENGADLKSTNNGKSALDYASDYGHSEIKKYLEDYKSN